LDYSLNLDLKVNVHKGTPARTKTQLKRKAIVHLRKLQMLPSKIVKLRTSQRADFVYDDITY